MIYDNTIAGIKKVFGGPLKFVSDTGSYVWDKAKEGAAFVGGKAKAAGKKVYDGVAYAGNAAYDGAASVAKGGKDAVKGGLRLAKGWAEQDAKNQAA